MLAKESDGAGKISLDFLYPIEYISSVYILKETVEYSKWLKKLKDINARVAVINRLLKVGNGNLGDYKSVGSGVLEFRITYGPGYRIYCSLKGNQLILLLIGGDKSSQKSDIRLAQELKKEYEA